MRIYNQKPALSQQPKKSRFTPKAAIKSCT
jgi:hypothetical protein